MQAIVALFAKMNWSTTVDRIKQFIRALAGRTRTGELSISVTVPFGKTKEGFNVETDQRLLLWRKEFTDVSTIGELWDDDTLVCYVLEDAVRKHKIPKITAIPAGIYEMKITWSPRFKKYLPEIFDVPGYSEIRIHAGNQSSDSDGCLLTGLEKDGDWVGKSRAALAKVIWLVRKKLRNGRLWLSIVGGNSHHSLP